MSLNMYLGEVQSQTQSMNAVCTATIQGMEQAIQSIDAFAIDTVLQGQTYSSAKSFFVQTFRPLAQGIIYLCEELIRQNNAFPSQFQSQVASTDVIEQELLEQIREIDRMKTSMEAVNQAMPIPGMDAMVNLFIVMRQKLQEKLDHLYQFNQTSSNNYSTALQLATSIATGLAEVQSGKGFSASTGIFSVKELNMEWAVAIQKKSEDKVHAVQIEKEAVKNDWFLMDSKVVKETAEETANGVEKVTGVVVKGIGNVINGEKYEKSFTEEKEGILFIKGLTLEAEPFVSSRTYDRFDVKDKEKREQTYGPMVGFTVAQAGIEEENIKGFGIGAEAKVALANAELGAHVENGNLHVGAEASLVKYEGGIKIPIPFMNKKLQIGGSASLATLGGSFEAGKSGFKFHAPFGPGVGLWGFGLEVSVKE
ncbi:T7SS effector LXG polymorphic toxin [Bacillus cereus group sp. BfR-BA-01310]|uniref:T7SS effector LXG polymorphic toxin n=1 Tax=Bacillus cereus group sp. BfR-BA-01310 TaxID=2920287 RepID=UPI001F5602BC|nr:T7SS effector LXG polymorphic toxin [Bacillus cereus group sp. BfR-BA-01310]